MLLKKFSVPANTVSDELFQLFITLLVKGTVHSDCKNCLFASFERMSSCSSRFIQLEQETNSFKIIEKREYIFENFNHITSCSSVFQALWFGQSLFILQVVHASNTFGKDIQTQYKHALLLLLILSMCQDPHDSRL